MSMRSSTTMTDDLSPGASEESKSSQAAGAVQQHAGAAVGAAKQEAGQVAQSAKHHALSVVDSASEELRTRGREQTDRLSGSLGSAAEELRRMADATEGSSTLGGVVRSLADNAERTARRLDAGGPEGVMDDVRRMGREHPMRFLAIAAAGGFFAARLLRSTDTEAVKQAVSSGDDSSGQQSSTDMISGQASATSGLTSGGGPAGGGTTPLPGAVGTVDPLADPSGRPQRPDPGSVTP